MRALRLNRQRPWTIALAAGAILVGGVAATFGQEGEGLPQRPANAPKSQHQIDMEEGFRLNPTLKIGDKAPDFSLSGIDGKKHSLADWKSSSVLAVMFICNHCPASQLYETRMMKMVADYKAKGVQFIAIQPNAVAALAPGELNFADVDDSLDSMKIHAKFKSFNFPYLYDGDTQNIAHLYGPKNTPHIFIFDKERKLRYEGRIDDSMREDRVKVTDARNAIDQLVAGKEVEFPQRPVFGCSIKWKHQTGRRLETMKEWMAQPVKLEPIDAAGLKKLRTNPDKKYLMINFWATWCGPCVEEFDDVLKTHMWYRSRDFEVVTVSTDPPEAKAAVLKFLNQHHSAVRNYQFASDDVYALQEAFDKKWDSGVPFTMVLDPEGKVIYQEAGEISMLKLRRTILSYLPDLGYIGNANYWAKSMGIAR
ncbi:MAG: redoxin domain-containing protein [Bryobacteraceae bacterium]